MLLYVLIYPYQLDVIFFRIFSVAKLLGYNGLFNRMETENTKLRKCDLFPFTNGMEWDKPAHARVC